MKRFLAGLLAGILLAVLGLAVLDDHLGLSPRALVEQGVQAVGGLLGARQHAIVTALPVAQVTVAPVHRPDAGDPIAAAERILEQRAQTAGKDKEAFSKLYHNIQPQDLDQAFATNWENIARKHSNAWPMVLVREGNSALVSLNYYTVSGRHPKTNMKSSSMLLLLTHVDGAWLLEGDAEVGQTLETKLLERFPAGFLAARRRGANAAMFGAYNCMFLEERAVFQGCSNAEIKFAWQEEDGSVVLGVWIANGTGNNLYYTQCNVTIEDQKLGKVVTLQNVEVGEIVPALTSRLVMLKVPAGKVRTGMRSWGKLDSHIRLFHR